MNRPARRRAAPWTIDQTGWLPAARRVPSPHFDARPAGAVPQLLVVHNISLPPGQFGGDAIERLFTGRIDSGAHPLFASLAGVRVSAHFVIGRDGALMQFVSCLDRAWHAGVSQFEGRPRCNDFSVGVELEGSDFVPFEDAQYATLARLTRALRRRFPLVAVRGHADIAPGRKTDPGPHFDWRRFMRAARLPAAFRPASA